MLRDYLLQDYAITHAMATGYGPGDEWESTVCHCCGRSLEDLDSYEIEEDAYGNWYCEECWENKFEEDE